MVWSTQLKKEIDANDRAFAMFLKKKGIDRFSYQASKEWNKSPYKAKQTRIFAKYNKKNK